MAYKPTLQKMMQLDELESKQGSYVPSAEKIAQLDAAANPTPTEPSGSFLGNLGRGALHGAEEFGRGATNFARQASPDAQLSQKMLDAVNTYPSPISAPIGTLMQVFGGSTIKDRGGNVQPNPLFPGEAIKPGTDRITREEAGIPRSQGVGGAIGEFLGNVAPSLAIPGGELLESPAFVSKAVSGLTGPYGKAAAKTAEMLGIAGKNALLGAGISPAYMPDTSIPSAMKTGAMFGGIGAPALKGLGAAGGLLGKGINKALMFGGNNTPEQIQAALDAAGKTNIPLGEAVSSPFLKKQQVNLTNVPFSGMGSQYQKIADSIVEPVKNVLSGYESKIKKTGGDDVVDHLKDQYFSNRKVSSDNYSKLDQIAKEDKASFSYKNYKDKAGEHLEKINASLAENPEFGKLKKDEKATLESFLKEITNKKDVGSFENASLAHAELNSAITDAIKNNETFSIGKLKSLRGALRKDFTSSAEDSGSTRVLGAFNDAQDYFKNNVAPFQEKNIIKFINDDKDPSQIGKTFISKSADENPEKANRLLSLLPDDAKKSLAHQFFTKGKGADDTASLSKAISEYMKLGPRTRELLLPPEDNKVLQDALSTSKLMGAQRNQMYMGPTGMQTASLKGTALGAAGPIMGYGIAGLPLAAGLMALPRSLTAALMSKSAKKAALGASKRLAKPKEVGAKTKGIPSALAASLRALNN